MNQCDASENEKANEIFATQKILTTKLHLDFIIVNLAFESYCNHQFTDVRIRPLFDQLVQLFAIKLLMQNSEGLYESGFFTKGSKRLMTDSFKYLLEALRPQMIPLVECFPQF